MSKILNVALFYKPKIETTEEGNLNTNRTQRNRIFYNQIFKGKSIR